MHFSIVFQSVCMTISAFKNIVGLYRFVLGSPTSNEGKERRNLNEKEIYEENLTPRTRAQLNRTKSFQCAGSVIICGKP